jgi:hypothetical protein
MEEYRALLGYVQKLDTETKHLSSSHGRVLKLNGDIVHLSEGVEAVRLARTQFALRVDLGGVPLHGWRLCCSHTRINMNNVMWVTTPDHVCFDAGLHHKQISYCYCRWGGQGGRFLGSRPHQALQNLSSCPSKAKCEKFRN